MSAAVERRIETFVARCTPAMAAQRRDARQRLRARSTRGIRLKTPADRDAPAVAALIDQAIEARGDALAAAPPLSTVIKAEAAKRRPRRPASAKA
jgi:hypothetical protein